MKACPTPIPPVRSCSMLCVLVFICLLCTSAIADVIHMKDGRKLEGEITEEAEEYIKLKMKYGSMTIQRSKIEKIEKGASKTEEFKTRFAAVNRKDTKALFKLAEWCKNQNLLEERRGVLRAVLEADPTNAKAGKLLGYEMDGQGHWHDPKEASKGAADADKTEETDVYEPTVDEKAEKEFLEAARERYKDKSDKELMDMVMQLRIEYKWREIVAVVRELDRRSPEAKNPTFGYNLARAYIRIGEIRLALAIAEENLPYVKRSPVFAKVGAALKILMGDCYCKLGDVKKAITVGEEAVAEDEASNLHFYNLGRFYLLDRQYKKTEERCRKGLEVSGDRSQFNRLLLATSLALQDNKDEARRLIDVTLSRLPVNLLSVSCMEIARTYAACGDAQNAAKYLGTYLTEYVDYQKKRNQIKEEVLTDPGFESVLKDRAFAAVIAVEESQDDSKWEFGVVREAQEKSIDQVKKIKTGRTKKKGRAQLPPILAPKDWVVIRTRNYDLLSNSIPERLEELAYRLEAVVRKYRELFGAKSLKMERFTVKMFKCKEEFDEYTRKKNVKLEHAQAYHSPGDKELVCYDRFSEGLGHKIFGVIYHEANHQFMYAYLGGSHPMWLAEGLACYFETAQYSGGRITRVGAMNYDRSNIVLEAVRTGKLIPLKKLLEMDRAAFYGANIHLNYAQAWHLVYFLINKNAATKKLFADYVKTFRETRDEKKAYDASFGKYGLARVEQEFKNYILKGK